MTNLRYYRNNVQLGIDIISLGRSISALKRRGPMRKKETAGKISADQIIKRLEWSDRKGIKLTFFEYLPINVITVRMIILISYLFYENFGAYKVSFTMKEVLDMCEILKMETRREIYSYLEMMSNNSVLMRSKVILFDGENHSLNTDFVKSLRDPDFAEGKKKSEISPEINSAADIKKALDCRVMGQERAKRTLSAAAYSYLRSIREKADFSFPNILMIGPTGSGKTHIIRILSEILGIPSVITDATKYSETGYVGADTLDMLYEINLKMKKSGVSAGIIYIDEIDKIAGETHHKREVSGRSVQEELLKILDKKEVSGKIYIGPGRYNFVDMDTSRLLFIAGGAFSGLDEAGSPTCGFEKKAKTMSGKDRYAADNLVKYGMIPELLGRLPVKVIFDELNTAELIQILKNPEVSPLKEFRGVIDGLNPENIPEEELAKIARHAGSFGTGARGLYGAIEEYFSSRIYSFLGEC